jgi:hypothetical protein
MRGTPRSRRAVVSTASLAAATALSTLAAPSIRAAGHHVDAPARTLAPGVTYERIEDPSGPWILHVVRVDPTQAATIDLAAGGPTMGTYAKPSDLGRAHEALVAINGDFGLRSGHPLHPFLLDGTLMGRGIQNGANFAITQDEAASFLGPDRLLIKGGHAATDRPFRLAEWNSGKPEVGEIVGFTRYGGRVEPPPENACAARLKPDGRFRWGKRSGVSRRYVVDVRRCRPAAMRARRKTVVLASRRRGTGATVLKAMKPGDGVRLSWSFGWQHVMDSIGGMPQLVDDGRNVAGTCGSYFCDRNPRTGVGVTADGTVLLVVVDGRSRDSVGMTLIEFGRAFLDLGAVEALNLDGGGSSAMWVKGSGVVSDPSDPSGERAVVNAMLVLPGADSGERPIAAPSFRRRVAPADGSRAARLAATDAGSTGGLADAWLRGALGMTAPPPASIVRASQRFRASR